MWLEVNAALTGFGCIFIGILTAVGMLGTGNLIFLALGIVSMMVVITGTVLISFKITDNQLIPLLDRINSATEEVAVFMTAGKSGGGLRFFVAKKAPYKRREFKYLKKDACIINTGKFPIRLLNGNPAFLCAEGYNEDIDPHDLYFAEKLEEDFKTTDIKKIGRKLKEKEQEDE